MTHESVIVRAMADIERQTLYVAVALNGAAYVFASQRPAWAVGAILGALAVFAAAYSQWFFRRCNPPSPEKHERYAYGGYGYRQLSIALWFASVTAFAVGAFYV